MLARVVSCYVSGHAVHNVAPSRSRFCAAELPGQKIVERAMIGILSEVFERALLGGRGGDGREFRGRFLIYRADFARRGDGIVR